MIRRPARANPAGGKPHISTSGAGRERVPTSPQTPETLVF
jgi:hypothetical protein